MTDIVLIAAVARNGVIGRDNDLPFRLPSDLKRFKSLTMGSPMVMGRLTFESLPGLLPGRPHLVVSGDPDYSAEGAETYCDLETALERAKQLAQGLQKDAAFVIGGGQIYAQTIEDADRLEITHIELEAEGSVVFPVIDQDIWESVVHTPVPAGAKDEADMVFATYRRRV